MQPMAKAFTPILVSSADDLETPQDQWSNPVFFAITAEPSADPRML